MSKVFYKAPTLTIQHLAEESPLTEMVKAEEKYIAEENERKKIESERDLKILLEDLYNLQIDNNFERYNSYLMLGYSTIKLNFKKWPVQSNMQRSIH